MKNDKFAFFIGVDVSKDKFNCAIINNKLELLKEAEFQMDIDGFNSFYDLIKKYDSSIIALESTGSYHINLLASLVSKKKDVCLINPALIKKFAQSVTLRKTKTDKIDAVIIAKFIAKNIEHFNYFALPESNDIIALARMREHITQQIAKVKTQFKQHLTVVFPELVANTNVFTKSILHILKHMPTAEIIRNANEDDIQKILDELKFAHKSNITPQKLISLAKSSIGISSNIWATVIKEDVEMLIFLNSRLDNITKEFIDKIKSSKKDDMEIITSIKGINDITSAHFLAEIKDINRFANKGKLAAYAGIDPAIKQSGSMYSNGRISKKGSRSFRRVLYLMASGVMKFNEYFRAYYLKKKEEGMPHRKAMIALCNKLVRVLYAMLIKKEVFHMPKLS